MTNTILSTFNENEMETAETDFTVSDHKQNMDDQGLVWVVTLNTDRAKALFDDCVTSLNFKTMSALVKWGEKMEAQGFVVR